MFAAKWAGRHQGDHKKVKFDLLGKSAAEAAKEAGVARTAVVMAKKVLRDGAPEVTAAVERKWLTDGKFFPSIRIRDIVPTCI